MKVALVTGSAGLIGSESVLFFADKFDLVIGIDNNFREFYFGKEGSTETARKRLEKQLSNYEHYSADIRQIDLLRTVFEKYLSDIKLIVHTAAQPSHDWAAANPILDFSVNANGTLNLLEMTRHYCPEAVFIYTSSSKVYGDNPNRLELEELESRWEVKPGTLFYEGISEKMSIDQAKHSLLGASKLAGDILVQEYGKYWGLKSGIFRGGCLTGPHHAGVELHGFLSYLAKCCASGKQYTVFGYKGKQVRDNIHCYDLVNAFWHFYQAPKNGEVYNIGGGRKSNCSILEAIELCENIAGKKMNYRYTESNRNGDHVWYITDYSKFTRDYPFWEPNHTTQTILTEIFKSVKT